MALTKRWELWVSVNGKRRERGLGVFPEVGPQAARDKADEIRRAARNGVDLRQRSAERARSPSFRQAFATYFAVKRKCSSRPLSTSSNGRARWSGTCFPSLETCRSPTSPPLMSSMPLTPIWYEKPETARRVLQRMEAVFKSAILRGTREKASPCVGVAQELQTRRREVRHHPALPWQEVPAFIERFLARSPRSLPATRLAFEFLILTATARCGARSGRSSISTIGSGLIPKRADESAKAAIAPSARPASLFSAKLGALNPDGVLIFEGVKRGRLSAT